MTGEIASSALDALFLIYLMRLASLPNDSIGGATLNTKVAAVAYFSINFVGKEPGANPSSAEFLFNVFKVFFAKIFQRGFDRVWSSCS